MRSIAIGLALLAGVGMVLPATTANAETKKVIIKKHEDNGLHLGWREHRRPDRVVIKHRSDRDENVGSKTIIKKKTYD